MRVSLLLKIKENKKLYDYLHNHSYWYKKLNRSDKNYDLLMKEFKEYQREVGMNKINSTIENIELFTNMIKFVD